MSLIPTALSSWSLSAGIRMSGAVRRGSPAGSRCSGRGARRPPGLPALAAPPHRRLTTSAAVTPASGLCRCAGTDSRSLGRSERPGPGPAHRARGTRGFRCTGTPGLDSGQPAGFCVVITGSAGAGRLGRSHRGRFERPIRLGLNHEYPGKTLLFLRRKLDARHPSRRPPCCRVPTHPYQ